MPHISVCVCTFKRPVLLARCLAELAQQQTAGLFTYSVVVADNDVAESAREAAASARVKTVYCVEPRQNIALARNAALAQAHGEFAAFIDDDELAAPDWLLALYQICERLGAAGVLGPVRPHFDQVPPAWMVRGKFFERPEYPTGTRLEWRATRTGNVLFRRSIVTDLEIPFCADFGNGGEDQDFFRRLMERGHVFVWCSEGVVREVVPANRVSGRYLLRRALLRGQNEKNFLTVGSVVKSAIAAVLYTLALPMLLFCGRHIWMRYLSKLLDHAGKLCAVLGVRPLGEKYLEP